MFLGGNWPEIPPAAQDVWDASVELEAGRMTNGYGYDAIAWSDVKAYLDLAGLKFPPWKIHALRSMENVWLKFKNKTDKDTVMPVEMNMQLFDAMFGSK